MGLRSRVRQFLVGWRKESGSLCRFQIALKGFNRSLCAASLFLLVIGKTVLSEKITKKLLEVNLSMAEKPPIAIDISEDGYICLRL
jgi:hypothetical protein